MIVMLIICTRCKENKPATEFYVRRAKKNGFTSQCKDCHRSQIKERRAIVRADRLAYQHQVQRYQCESDESIDTYYQMLYEELESDRLKAIRKYYLNRRKQIWEFIKKWKQENPEIVVEKKKGLQRRKKVKTIKQFFEHCENAGWQCFYCHCDLELHSPLEEEVVPFPTLEPVLEDPFVAPVCLTLTLEQDAGDPQEWIKVVA